MKWHILLAVVFTNFTLTAQTLPDFELPDATSGKPLALKNVSSKNVLVIIFYSNTCPYDAHYAERINTWSTTYADRATFLLVNAHTEKEESLEAMKQFTQQHSITLPYVADKDQKLMNALGARKSPEGFVLKKNGSSYSVIYHGMLDDNPQAEGSVTQPYLKDAIEQTLTGATIQVKETRPVGCSMKKTGM